jgi:site-specific DNA-methyltransferase (adenine-specific)
MSRRTVKVGSGRVLVGSCLDRLKDLPDASIDSIVTDPPYELGFMGKQWDASGVAYNVELWRECLRVLKPGGHLLAFGGTRTYHRMAVAIEDAGFEIRDSIHWMYGSGFPKSLDVSKAIDKAAGAEREVTGHRITGTMTSQNGTMNAGNGWLGGQTVVPVTAAATDAAKQWEGWGTALKPAHEPIVVARKPMAGTVAANVLEHGTGALNIDGCRVGFVSDADERESKDKNRHADFGTEPGGNNVYGDYSTVPRTNYNPPGRWPANIVLTHAADCRLLAAGGTETVREMGTVSDMRGGNYGQDKEAYADRPKLEREVTSYKDTPAVWSCVPGCPVAELDRQSGVSKSQTTRFQVNGRSGGILGSEGAPRDYVGGHNDTGGASRFFTVTEWDEVPFLYVAKPGKKERNAGLDGLPESANKFGNQKNGNDSGDRSVNDKFTTAPRQNHHPTVKPVALMRHLVRLVTPPGGVVLDPFLGSGTTAVAAELEGFRWVGCEMTAEYLPIIKGRVKHAHDQAQKPKQMELPEAA